MTISQFDEKTLSALQHQGRRMSAALAEKDRKEAAIIQRRVDDILDNRPRVHTVAPDGEIVYDNASPWVLEQAQTTAVNATGEPEPVLTPQQWYGFLEEPDDDRGEPNGGGVGLLDRP